VTEAKAVDVEPPEISLDLSAASNPVAYNGGVDPNNVVFSGTQLTIPQYATHCNVITDNAETCKEPIAAAFDHHEGYLSVSKTVKVWISSDPKSAPVHANQVVADVSYTHRGEYSLTYDATDSSGNQAETIAYAMVMQDHQKPLLNPFLADSVTVEACDKDNTLADTSNRVNIQMPPSSLDTASDNYDGDVTNRLVLGITPSDSGLRVAYTSSETIEIDTRTATRVAIDYSAKDYANIFGENAEDNEATHAGEILVVDTLAPSLYCNTVDFKTSPDSAFTSTYFSETAFTTISDCADACFNQQWERSVGSKTSDSICAYFQTTATKCLLFTADAASEYGVGTSSGVTQGYPVQCQESATVECATPAYTDPGATCIDMHDSATADGGVDPAKLSTTVTHAVDTATVGTYPVTYSCADAAGHAASEVTLTVQIRYHCAGGGHRGRQHRRDQHHRHDRRGLGPRRYHR